MIAKSSDKLNWRESIARMEAELAMHYSFVQFIAEENAIEQCALTSQAEELEAVIN